MLDPSVVHEKSSAIKSLLLLLEGVVRYVFLSMLYRLASECSDRYPSLQTNNYALPTLSLCKTHLQVQTMIY